MSENMSLFPANPAGCVNNQSVSVHQASSPLVSKVRDPIALKVHNGDVYIISEELIAKFEAEFAGFDVYDNLQKMSKWLGNKPNARPMGPSVEKYARDWLMRSTYDFSLEATGNTKQIKQCVDGYPSLECPLCEKMTSPRSKNKDGSVTYSCPADHVNHGSHYTWRIDADGNLIE